MRMLSAAVASILIATPAALFAAPAKASEEDIVLALVNAPFFTRDAEGNWTATGGTWRVAQLSACTATRATLEDAVCVIKRGSANVGEMGIDYGYWDGDIWKDTLVPRQVAMLADHCSGYNAHARCTVSLRGYPYRVRGHNGEMTFRLRAYDVRFVNSD